MKEVKETFEIRGIWWHSEISDKRYSGTLKKDEKGIWLTLEEYNLTIDEFTKTFAANNLQKVALILGETDTGKITLQNCIETNVTTNLSKRITTYYVERVFKGFQFEKTEDIAFRRLAVAYSYLDEWLNIFNLTNRPSGQTIQLEYRYPGEIVIKLNDALTIKIIYEVKGPNRSYYQSEVKILQKALVKFVFPTEVPLIEADGFVQNIQDFLVFSTQQMVRIETLEGESDKKKRVVNNITIFEPIAIISQEYFDFNKKRISPFDFLFAFKDVRDRLGDVLKRWVELYASIKPQLQLYLIRFYNPKLYVEYQFLSMVQALEGYHRSKFNGAYMPKEDYKRDVLPKLLGGIPDKIDQDFKQALCSKLDYGHEYSFRRRMKELLTNIPKQLSALLISDEQSFIEKIKATRDYFVHQDDELKSGTAQGHDVYELTVRLQLVFETIILQELNFSEQELMNIMKAKLNRLRMLPENHA